MQDSKIAWTHHTVNPWWGCHPVSLACDNCYARALSRRTAFAKEAFAGGPYHIRTAKAIAELLRLQQKAMDTAQRARVFVESMGDFFEDQPFLLAAQRDFILAAGDCDWLDLLFLTKRPENIVPVCRRAGIGRLPRHIWLGITAETEGDYCRRWPKLSNAARDLGHWQEMSVTDGAHSNPCRVGNPVHTFVSCEPMLGFQFVDPANNVPDWIIVGAEKIGNRPGRPLYSFEVRSLRDRCRDYHIPLFVKQTPTEDGKHITDDPSQFALSYPRNREFPSALDY